ncbi:MAG TPA: GlsB/YeaQ/YmgE family stress response membrane protein [Acidobacteriota bacterium]|nr:GlsB/YeaQ/YmgE family stress response membrane protein [Acidobacteriota bacterium]
MNLLWIILIGFVAGAVAKFIMPGKDPKGCLITIALGVAGALLSTLLGRLVGWYSPGEAAGFIGAVVGAVILLVLYRILKKK